VQKEEPGLYLTWHIANPPTRLESDYRGAGGAVGYRLRDRFDVEAYVQRVPQQQSPFDDYYRPGHTTVGLRLVSTADVLEERLARRIALSGSVNIADASQLYRTRDTFRYESGAKLHAYGGHAEGLLLVPLRRESDLRTSPGLGLFGTLRTFTPREKTYGTETQTDPAYHEAAYGLVAAWPVSVRLFDDDWLTLEPSARLGLVDVFYSSRDVYSLTLSYSF
jgi:hypothetical protein